MDIAVVAWKDDDEWFVGVFPVIDGIADLSPGPMGPFDTKDDAMAFANAMTDVVKELGAIEYATTIH